MRRDESGQIAGIEVLPLGVLTFLVTTLLVANAWAVVDAKLAVSAAAREATRAYVEAPGTSDPYALADAAARAAVVGFGRQGERLELRLVSGAFARCQVVRFEASYRVPALVLLWVGDGGKGRGFTASAVHSEVVDPYRSGVPGAGSECDTG